MFIGSVASRCQMARQVAPAMIMASAINSQRACRSPH
ncbi:Uncharacterised protein [Mycobacteroides abscessus subsp. abscessus]|nr:Uncharacterised protein [Mycobacteroides abscessus subsp. abscessus]